MEVDGAIDPVSRLAISSRSREGASPVSQPANEIGCNVCSWRVFVVFLYFEGRFRTCNSFFPTRREFELSLLASEGKMLTPDITSLNVTGTLVEEEITNVDGVVNKNAVELDCLGGDHAL